MNNHGFHRLRLAVAQPGGPAGERRFCFVFLEIVVEWWCKFEGFCVCLFQKCNSATTTSVLQSYRFQRVDI